MTPGSSSQQSQFLTLNDYQGAARETDQNKLSNLEGLAFPLLGLFGEVGTLLSALKKKQRDQESYIGYTASVVEEFGDALWYLSNIATRATLSLDVLAQRAFRGLNDWDQVEDRSFGTFSGLQEQKNPDGSPDSMAFQGAIITLAGKVGLLLNDFHLDRIKSNRDVLSAHLVEIFRALIDAANVADIDLASAASRNIQKIHSRWPLKRDYTQLFDVDFDKLEQLPRRIDMHIFEVEKNKKKYVI
jgi:NTP pyrophosphatase (non-canonical NTP hydrolase)